MISPASSTMFLMCRLQSNATGFVDAPIDRTLVPIRTMFLDKPLNVELVATPRR